MPAARETAAVLCAGGAGTRMWPTTKALNKHLLPVFNKPLIYYPLSLLMLVGVREIGVVTSPTDDLQIRSLLSDGSQWGLSVSLWHQYKPDGIVGCLACTDPELNGRAIYLMLGDNFFYGPGLPRLVAQVQGVDRAATFLTHVADTRAFARVEVAQDGRIASIEEKPIDGGPGYAATGLYHFPADVWERVDGVGRSQRGELEVTSLLQTYLEEDRLDAIVLPRGSVWLDCGTALDLQEASNLVGILEERGGHLLGSPEEIAWRSGWISDEQLYSAAMDASQSDYSRKLLQLLAGRQRDPDSGASRS